MVTVQTIGVPSGEFFIYLMFAHAPIGLRFPAAN